MHIRHYPVALAQLIHEYNSDDTTDERRTALEHELQQLTCQFEKKLDALASVISLGRGNVELLNAECKRLSALAKSREATLARLERFVVTLIDLSGVRAVNTDHHRLCIGVSKYVGVINEDSIPRRWLREIPSRTEPDKAAISTALKSGESIDGVELRERSYLVIR